MQDNFDLDRLLELVHEKNFVELKKELSELNEVDIAELLDELDRGEAVVVFRMLPKDKAASVFSYMEDTENQELLINALSDKELHDVIGEMYLDDAADLVEDMPANVVSRMLRNTDSSVRQQINQLLSYPEDSAGSIMTTEYVYLHKTETVREAFERIRRTGPDKETIYTCYVTEGRKLEGVVSVRRMLLSNYEQKIGDIMETNYVFVNTHDDKEEVAQIFSRYDLTAVPVVDNDDCMVGIVTFDDAMDVIEDEATEDIEKMAAIVPTEKTYLRTGIVETFKSRIPWLMLLMISATFTGMIINNFESALAACVALTGFIPMLMDTSGNAGSQASVTIIRALSLNDIEFRDILRVIWKEVRVAVLCGGSLAAVNYVKILLVDRMLLGNDGITYMVDLVVCVALFVTVICAKIVGCTLPMLASKVHLDPAVMASPFITTIVDAVSLLIYFQFARTMLGI